MKDLQEMTQRICELKGEALAMQCMINAIINVLPRAQLLQALHGFHEEAELARVVLLNSDKAGDGVLSGFELYVQRQSTSQNL